MNTRKLITSTLFAAALSAGTAGVATIAAGSASADQLSPVRDCNVQSNALCHHPWQGPTLPGPYYP